MVKLSKIQTRRLLKKVGISNKVIQTQKLLKDTASVYVTDYEGGGSKIVKSESSPTTGKTTITIIRKSSPSSSPQITTQILQNAPQQNKIPTFIITKQTAPIVNRNDILRLKERINKSRNIISRRISRGLSRSYEPIDIISGGKLTQYGINTRQQNLNKEIEKFNKDYEGKKELPINDYALYELRYKNLEEKQKQIETKQENLSKSGRGKWGEILATISGKNFYKRTPEQAKEEMKKADKNLSELQNKIEKLERKGGVFNKTRINISRKLLTTQLNDINDIKNLENRKIFAGYVIISPAPLGVKVGFKSWKQGLKDLYGIRLKNSKYLTNDIKQYYVKPSKAQLKKIQLRQAKLKAYDKQILKQIKRIKVVKKIDRKSVKYVGKIGKTKFYELKKPLSIPKPKTTGIKKIPSSKVKYLGKYDNVKFFKLIEKNKVKILNKSELPRYKYLGKYDNIKFYKKLKPIKSLKNNYGILGNEAEINKRYSLVGKYNGVKIYKIKKNIKLPKLKKDTISGRIYRDKKGLYAKVKGKGRQYLKEIQAKPKEYYINEKGEIIRGREIFIKIDISQEGVKNLIVKTINKMPVKRRNIFLSNLKKINKRINIQVKQANFIKTLNKVKIPISTFRNISSELAVLSQLYKQKLISKEKLDDSQRKILKIRGRGGQGEGQGEGQTLRQIQAQNITQIQIQAQRQAEKIVLKQIERLGGVTQINKQKLILFLHFKFKKGRTETPKNFKTGWAVYGLSQGVYRRLNKKPLSKQDALSRGAYAIDRTTSRTFKIVPIPNVKGFGRLIKREKGYFTLTKPKFREYRIIKGQKKALIYTLIEKRKYLIDTLGEKKGLSLYRYLAKLKKQGKY